MLSQPMSPTIRCRWGEIPDLISQVHAALKGVTGGVPEEEPEALRPAVPIKKSVTAEYIICLDDGKKFKSLKRHLSTRYGLTPDDYRAKWGLSADYPVVAPNYAAALGIGQDYGARPQTKRAGKAGAGEADPQEGRSLISAIEVCSGARCCHRHNLHLRGI